MSDTRKTGQVGEDLAAEYLVKKGYKILERNRHFSRACEVDIIALDKKTLVFAEVKTRNTNVCGAPFEAITKTKYQKIRTGLYTYLSENPQYKQYRIDGISVILKPTVQIEHLQNI